MLVSSELVFFFFFFGGIGFSASDGKLKLRVILPTSQYSEVLSGKIQNLGLISNCQTHYCVGG